MGKMITEGDLYDDYGLFSEGSLRCPTYLEVSESGCSVSGDYEDNQLVDEDDITGFRIDNPLTCICMRGSVTITSKYPVASNLTVGGY